MAKKAKVYTGTEWVDLAAATTDLSQYPNMTTTPISGFRNALINGDFRIWQRGTGSFLGTGYNYCADRWMEFRGGFASGMTVTRQSTGLAGFQYGVRLQRDSGNTSTQPLNLQQTLETANSIPFQGKTVTVSFYARVGANFSASGINFYIHTGEGTDQAASNQNYAWTNPQTYTQIFTGLTTTWTRYTFTTTLSSTLTQLGIKLDVTPTGTAGANDWIEFTGFQLELGSIATPFEQRPIGTELALCQRYYKRWTVPGINVAFAGLGLGAAAATNIAEIYTNTAFRAAPTAIDSANVSAYRMAGQVINGGTLSLVNPTADGMSVMIRYTGSAGQFATAETVILIAGAANAYIGLSAEL